MQRCGRALLVVEADELVGSREMACLDQPQGDRPAERQLRRLVDGADRTARDQPIDPEGADPRAGLDRGYPADSRNPAPRVK